MLAVCALALAAPAALRAQPVANLHELVPAGHMAGQGRLRFWGMDVYDASLWVAPGFRHVDFALHGFALQLRYMRAFSGADIARRSVEEMQRAAAVSPAQAAAWQSALARLLPDVTAGDRITGVNQPGRGAQLFHNGRPLGEVGDAQFARLFFGIWLAPSSSEPGLRAALLAGAER